MSVTLWLEPTEKGSKEMLSKSFETFLLPISNLHAGGGGVSYSTKQFSDPRGVCFLSFMRTGAGLVVCGEQSVPCFPSRPLDRPKTWEKMSVNVFKPLESKRPYANTK